MIDAYSRFPEVAVVQSTSAKATIPQLEKIFATHGIPHVIKSDISPPFSSAEIRLFMDENGPVHKRITPLRPQANAPAENFVKPLTNAIRTVFTSQKSWKKELNKFLLNYRAAPHSTTGFAPAKLLYNRDIHAKLPQVTTHNTSQTHMEVCKRDALAKERMKQHSDGKKRAKESNLKIGDTVLVQQPKRNTFTTKYDPKPYTIARKKGTLIEAERNDHRITRNASFFKKRSLQDKGSYDYDDNYDYDDYDDD